MTAEHYRTMLLKHWRIIALCCLLLGAGAALGSLFFPPVYQSTVTIQLVIPSADASLIGSTDKTTLSYQTRTDRTNQTEVNLATSDSILAKVAAHYPGLTVGQLKSDVSARVVESTNLFQITVSDHSSARAAHLANDLAAALVAQQAQDTQQVNVQAQQPLRDSLAATQKQIDADTTTLHNLQSDPAANQQQIQTLQIELSALQSQYDLDQQALTNLQSIQARTFAFLQVANAAQPSSKPLHSNQWLIDAAAGLGLGLLLGISLVLLRDRLDQRVRTISALSELVRWPVLARLEAPALDKGLPASAPAYDGTQHQRAYEVLGQNLAFLGVETPLFSIVVTGSPSDVESSSVVAGDLALFLAREGKRVVLVDANFSGPSQSRRFGIPSEPGLGAAVLEFNTTDSEKSLLPYVYQVEDAPLSLRVLPAGPIPPNPRQVLKSRTMREVFHALSETEADVVVLSSPPVTGSAESCALAALADGVVVVIDRRQARKERLAHMKRSLEEAGARVLGYVVFSKLVNRSKPVVQQDVLEGTSLAR